MAQTLTLLIILSLLLLLPASFSTSTGIRVHLTHVDSKLNLTKTELHHRALQRTKQRVASLTSTITTTDVEAPVHASTASFQMDLAIGTPSLPLTLLVDTGSDLIWTQCQPCIQCFNQPTPIYNPLNSNTFVKLACTSPLCKSFGANNYECTPDCKYYYPYADNSSTQGVLATETFTFGSTDPVSVPGIGFGCGQSNQGEFDNSAGLVGLGRGQLSLVTQLGSGKFSYCLTSFSESNTSPLLLGSFAVLRGAVQSTPLLINPIQPSFYYLSLQGITVGATLLPIPDTVFALNEDGSGGLIIDSGSTYTSLAEEGFQVLKQEFQAQVNLPVAPDGSGLGIEHDLCFSVQRNSPVAMDDFPKLVFHFAGADMEFPRDNYLTLFSSDGLLCLTIVGNGTSSVLGNNQQQNMHILYDLEGGMLSFVPTRCDQL